ncbi:MAG TPA: SDR family NAD(P)-dependent oxidoreductase [Polyangiaceae bacterium]|jgi:NAD(P)-dependent dehydrogenase (short-subunit alcohol dehydrogenase family)
MKDSRAASHQSVFAGKSVVVTGAASGIGRATALAFARQRAELFVCDLPGPDLLALERALRDEGASSALALAVDVGSREQMAAFAERVCQQATPDVIVNNAGVGLSGGSLDTTLDDWEWVLRANLWGVVHGCHFFAPRMAERGRGQIVNIASAAGFYNSAKLAAYGTTKYAVVGFSEALRAELAPRGVGVSVVCPGFINTPIIERMRVRGSADPERERRSVLRFYQKRNYAPERVADAILKATQKNLALLPVAPEAWALYLLQRAVPSLSHRVVDGVQALLNRKSRGDP